MKYLVLAALMGFSSGVHVHGGPDVYGPNGAGYTNTSPNYDMSRIGISITQAGSGPKCTPRDWAQVHWKAYLKDGRLVSDSRSEGMGYPKEFSVGASQVFKCWDLVLPQLHQGDHATLDCPSYYAWGDAYTQSPLGGEPIPLKSDIDFEIEVVQCAHVPEREATLADSYSIQPHTTTMQPNRCFYLHSQLNEDSPMDWVLTTRKDNGQFVAAVEHKVLDDLDQHWYWNIADGSLHNEAHPDMVLDASDGFNRLVLAKPNGNAGQQHFDYMRNDRFVSGGGYHFTINHDDWTVRTTSDWNELQQFWHLEYCFSGVTGDATGVNGDLAQEYNQYI